MIGVSGYSLEHIGFTGKPAGRRKSTPDSGTEEHGLRHSTVVRESLDPFVAWVLESAGLNVDAYRPAPMRRRMTACLRALKTGSIAEARSRLTQHPELGPLAADALLIGVTEFYRDTAVFEEIEKFIATDLANRKEPIRIWSAGCSNGAELYSVATLLAESQLLNGSSLIGTDCRASAIREAQAGFFSESAVRPVTASLRRKYLRNEGRQFRVIGPLRSQCEWRVVDILAECLGGPWDIILCRNLAIYLEMNAASQLWNMLAKQLRPGGLLVTGKAERPPASAGLTNVSRCIYRLPFQHACEPRVKTEHTE